MTKLTTEDIDAVCGLVDELCGICWDDSKAYLIESRLRSLVQQERCENYHELVRKVRAEIDPGLKSQVVDAVTTNETLWFRDSSPFEAFRNKLIPELIDSKACTAFPRRLRIWSAACSTGQEAYSIAIALAETISDFLDWDIQILGTDISSAAIEQASYGAYKKLEIDRGLTQELVSKYFSAQENDWRICDEIRSMCTFEQRNLLEPFDDLVAFDVIFCRNVAIYFNDEDRRSLFERTAEVLAPNGWLFVGSSESLFHLGPRWQPVQHCRASCYHPNMT